MGTMCARSGFGELFYTQQPTLGDDDDRFMLWQLVHSVKLVNCREEKMRWAIQTQSSSSAEGGVYFISETARRKVVVIQQTTLDSTRCALKMTRCEDGIFFFSLTISTHSFYPWTGLNHTQRDGVARLGVIDTNTIDIDGVFDRFPMT